LIVYVVGVEGTDRTRVDSIWLERSPAIARADELNEEGRPSVQGAELYWTVAEVITDTPDAALDFTLGETGD
jgi:hypothetical protein